MRWIEFDCARCRVLHGEDLSDDRFGGLGGLHGERFDLGGDHGEAAAGFAGARRLDRGIERKQICLSGNGLDEFDDVADFLGGIAERRHFAVGGLRFLDGHAHDGMSLLDLTGDFGDGVRQFIGRKGRRLHAFGSIT